MRTRSVATLLFAALAFAPGLVQAAGPAAKPAPAATPAVKAVDPKPVSANARAEGVDAFLRIARVLQSPRCQNCHPAGDAPLQKDDGRPHAQLISRKSESVGLTCAACHNEAPLPGPKMPPGAPNWHLPPEKTPMVFQGKTPADLCAQLKDPQKNGGKDLKAMLRHVQADPLVLYGWNPGEGRTLPPLTHTEFVDAFVAWVATSAPCPP